MAESPDKARRTLLLRAVSGGAFIPVAAAAPAMERDGMTHPLIHQPETRRGMDLSAAAGASLVGFQQPGKGAVRKTVQDKLRESVSVTDFGAAGDGTNNDTEAFQAAINSMRGSGGTIDIPAGTYKITATLNVYSRISLKGVNTLLSRLDFSGLPKGAAAIEMTPAEGSDCEYAHLSDFTMSGNRTRLGTAISVRKGRSYRYSLNERLRIESFYRGYYISGEMYSMRLHDIEANYMVYPFLKKGDGYMTSLQASWIKFYQCFHGFTINNTTYSSFSYYYDHCGLSTNWPESPANEVPVSFAAENACTNLEIFTGQEYSKAMVLYASKFSSLSISCALVASVTSLWVHDPKRTGNIAGPEQGLFSNNTSNIEIKNLSFVLRASDGYPAAKKTGTMFLKKTDTGADVARTTFTNCFIDIESYYFCNLEASKDEPSSGNIATDPGNRLSCISSLTLEKKNYALPVAGVVSSVTTTSNHYRKDVTIRASGKGSAIVLPVQSQGHENTTFLMHITGIDGTHNSRTPMPFVASFAFGCLTELSGLASWELQSVRGIAARGMNIVISLNRAVTDPILHIRAISPQFYNPSNGTELIEWHKIRVV